MKKGLLLLIIVSLFMVSCGNDDAAKIEEAKKAELVKLNAAISYLEDGNYETAYISFGLLSKELVYYKAEALYGHIWSSMLFELNKLVDDVATLLTTVSGAARPTSQSPEEQKKMIIQMLGEYKTQGGGGTIGTILSGMLTKFFGKFNKWDEEIKEIEKIKHLNFNIDSLPVTIMNLTTIMDFGGEHDMGEVYFLDALFNTTMAWINFINSIDFNINILDQVLLQYATNYIIPKFSEENVKVMPIIIHTLTLLLNDNPTLFNLDKNGGIEKTKLARDEFFTSFKSFADTIREIKSEKDDQSNDLIEYQYDKENNKEYAVFNIKDINLSTSAVPGGDQLGNVTISKEGELKLNIGEDATGTSMADRLDKIANNFTTNGERISWAQDIAPILSSLIVMILNSGMLNSVIEAAVSGAGDDNSMGDSLNSIMGSDLINEDLITGVLTGFIPDIIQLDFGSFYNNPPNYRELLPAWTSGLTAPAIGMDGKKVWWPADEFVLEFECGDSTKPIISPTGAIGPLLIDSFVCNNKYSLAVSQGADVTNIMNDTAHFQKSSWIWKEYKYYSDDDTATIADSPINNIPPIITSQTTNPDETYQGYTTDGVESIIPYMYFKDPTFGSLIYLKMAPLNFKDNQWDQLEECNAIKENFGLPDNKCLNASLGKLLSDLINSLNLADSLAIGVSSR